MRIQLISLVFLVFPSLAACSATPEVYSASESQIEEHTTADGFERVVQIDVKGSAGEIHSVRANLRLHLQKGAARFETETVNLDGQRVTMEEKSSSHELTVRVDNHPPVVVAPAANGQYMYDGEYYPDGKTGKAQLAGAIADQLKEDNLQDDSMVANTRAIEIGHQMIAAHGGKLFFVSSVVDILTEVEAKMNIQMGANNSADF